MRLFLALRCDSTMTKTLTGVMHELKSHGVTGSFAPAQNLHMTLVFIGETDRVREVKAAAGSVPVAPMRITLDRFAVYGNTLVAETKGNQKLKEYVSGVRSALGEAGIAFDSKKFSPHITLVRKAGGAFREVQLPRESMTVSRVSLMKSVCRDGKTVYSEIAGWEK